ncbi:hypothetical protein UYSO10_1342 [Kosakonia radicincitans]|nr:hypothetical protein UYSO10_1342 [Kosakonia radicincitans]
MSGEEAKFPRMPACAGTPDAHALPDTAMHPTAQLRDRKN